MVECTADLDGLFGSLADSVRRDILSRLVNAKYSVSQLAEKYPISLAAVAKHLQVLEKAKLVVKERRGKEQIVAIVPETLHDAAMYLERYRELWEFRFAGLDSLLKEEQ